jgi:solute:Na+ symporter, SSS family
VCALGSFSCLMGCMLGSLLTPATPIEVLRTFYTRVRPFGVWNPVRAAGSTAPQVRLLPTVINIVTGAFALAASILSVFFLIGHYFTHFIAAIGIALVCAIIPYHSWYNKLPMLCAD